MRMKLILTLAVLVVSVALCAVSMYLIFGVLDDMDDMTSVVLERSDAGDREGARETLAQMALIWQDAQPLLEALTPHEDLHEVQMQYVEAATNLESGDMDDFARSVALLKESLSHLRDHESLSWSNLF